MLQKTDQRDYLFDNYKTLLIFLIVIGHFIEQCYDSNVFFAYLKLGIYVFHVPAFVFVSGYFSKKDYPVNDLIGKLLVPYLIYEVIYYFFYTYVLHVETGLYILYPKFSLWYLLCLFGWRLAASRMNKNIIIFSITIIAGLLIGLSQIKDNFLSLPRMIVFFPFFLAGNWLTKENVELLRRKKIRIFCIAALTVTFGIVFLTACFTEFSPKIFYGRYNYIYLEQEVWVGMLCRLVCYLAGFIITLSFIGALSARQQKWSYIGRRTMAIYILHGFVYNFFKEKTSLIDHVATPAGTILLLASCIILTLILSLPVFTRLTSFISVIYAKLITQISTIISKVRKKS